MIALLLSATFLLSGNIFAGNLRYLDGIVRGNPERKAMAFVFTGGWHNEGTEHILNVLKAKQVPGNFFLTGNFLRNRDNEGFVRRMLREGHFVGGHSDKHPKYCDYSAQRRTLISHEAFNADLQRNFDELARFGVGIEDARYFIPPSEHYNRTIVRWAKDFRRGSTAGGLTLINMTYGTGTNADYIGEASSSFKSSKTLFDRIWEYESRDRNGLNGHMMLIHLGVGSQRKDKFFFYLGAIIEKLHDKGYEILSVEELLGEH